MNARFFGVEGEALRCTLCPHRCRILLGKSGLCRVRGSRAGTAPEKAKAPAMEVSRYGYITALALDPVEKKPLYHWRPGSRILSVGFAGCNLRCPFCQNWHISQTADPPGRFMTPEALAAEARAAFPPLRSGAAAVGQIAYTYSEPLVHTEFVIDAMTAAREAGIAGVLVTNGCVNAEAAEAALSLAGAVNVDLKCFSEKTYAEILGGNLEAVLDFIRLAVSLGVHTEITTLVVPGLNDGEKEMAAAAEFIAGLGEDSGGTAIPWHLSAYHPDWQWDAPATETAALFAAAERARSILPWVYAGNTGGGNDTVCLHCGAVLVRRRGYAVDTAGLTPPEETKTAKKCFYRCAACGEPAPFRF